MKVCEADALIVQVVEIRCLDDRIAMGGYVAIALIVGKHENNVGPLRALTG